MYFHVIQTVGVGVDYRTTKRERRSITGSRRPVSVWWKRVDPVCVGGVLIPCVVGACRSHVWWGRVDPVCVGCVSIPCVLGACRSRVW